MATDFDIKEFERQIGRAPTEHEKKWVGRWQPQDAIRHALLNPEGAPDALHAIKIADVWEDVSLYVELTVSALPNKRGIVTGFRSLRYHNGNDDLFPLRSESGEILRTNGGHIARNPVFTADKVSQNPVNECTWPVGIGPENRGVWHVETFVRLAFSFVGKRFPEHFRHSGPIAILAPKKQADSEALERRVAELEAALAKAKR